MAGQHTDHVHRTFEDLRRFIANYNGDCSNAGDIDFHVELDFRICWIPHEGLQIVLHDTDKRRTFDVELRNEIIERILIQHTGAV
ncbi:hypothetical protein D3C81_1894940 [compost metagenome]